MNAAAAVALVALLALMCSSQALAQDKPDKKKTLPSGTRELQGLKVMMALLNNWDTKDENNVVLVVPARGGNELRDTISDLGATLGDTGKWPLLWRFTRSRNDPSGFRGDKLIDEIKEDGRVDFEFSGKKRGIYNDITVEQASWLGKLLARLSDAQLRDAFRAANYSPAEVRTLSRAVRARINELCQPSPQNRRLVKVRRTISLNESLTGLLRPFPSWTRSRFSCADSSGRRSPRFRLCA